MLLVNVLLGDDRQFVNLEQNEGIVCVLMYLFAFGCYVDMSCR